MKKIKQCYIPLLCLILLPVALFGRQSSNLKIQYFCTTWGKTDNWETFCKRAKDAGYDGIETRLPPKAEEREQLFDALQKNDLAYILVISTYGQDFQEIVQHYREDLLELVKYKPVLINSQTGKEYFSFEQNQTLIKLANTIGKEHQVKILHETHRGRFSFAAHITADYLDKIPDLRLTLDISHWCNVHDSMLEDQQETVEKALLRADHIHTRVGFPEGPQINDPRAPEWKKVVAQHLAWWDEVIRIAKEEHRALLTITPEFGPPDYMPTAPYSRKPLSDQWDDNVYMLNLLKSRYKK